MFFYTALFVASVIAALVILYLYKGIVGAGNAVYQALLPSSKNNSTSHGPEIELATTINETLVPWGWKSQSTPARPVKRNPAPSSKQTPWGWKGNNHKTREKAPGGNADNNSAQGLDAFFGNNSVGMGSNRDQKPTVGWPYREEKFEFAGRAYKVTRKATPAKTNLRDTGKPWGW